MASKKLDAAYDAAKDTSGLWVDPTFIEVGLNYSRQQEEPGQKDANLARAISIHEQGQQVPAIVYKSDDGKLHLVGGFGRLQSVTLLRNGFEKDGVTYYQPDAKLWVTVNADIVDEKGAVIASILENVRREVSPVNVGLAQQLLRDTYKLSDTEIAKIYGYNNTNAVSRHKKLLVLDSDTQKLVHGGKLSVDAALKAQELPEAEKAAVIAEAKSGKKVTAAAIADKKAEAIEKQAEATGTEATTSSNPRNAAAVKKFINESIVGNDDVPRDIQALFIQLRKYIEGTCTEKAIFNRINEIGGK